MIGFFLGVAAGIAIVAVVEAAACIVFWRLMRLTDSDE